MTIQCQGFRKPEVTFRYWVPGCQGKKESWQGMKLPCWAWHSKPADVQGETLKKIAQGGTEGLLSHLSRRSILGRRAGGHSARDRVR